MKFRDENLERKIILKKKTGKWTIKSSTSKSMSNENYSQSYPNHLQPSS